MFVDTDQGCKPGRRDSAQTGPWPQTGSTPSAMSPRPNKAAWAGLIVLVLLLHAPGLFAPGYVGEEGRRAMMAAEMLRSGDLLVPHVGGEPYLTKPPLYPWLAALFSKALGGLAPWTVRLPALLATLAGGATLLLVGTRWAGRAAGLLAAGLWLLAPGVGAKATLAETDQVLTVCVLIGTLGLLSTGTGGLLLAIGGIAGALLVKGPAGLVFFGALGLAAALRRSLNSAGARRMAVALGLGSLPLVAWSFAVSQAVPASNGGDVAARGWIAQLLGDDVSFVEYLGARLHFLTGAPLSCLPAVLLLPWILKGRGSTAATPQVREHLRTLGLGALLAFAFFLVYPRSESRYFAPALPWIALGAGAALATNAVPARTRRAVVVFALLAGLLQVGRELKPWVSSGKRALQPATAATLSEYLQPGETLHYQLEEHDLLALLDHPLRHVRKSSEVPGGGALFALAPGPKRPGWTVLAQVEARPGQAAVLVRSPPSGQ
jgi:4-amino-4-deoxy-L-arabinose transferase-like glycosyltransferase